MKTNFSLPPVAETSKLLSVVQTARYSHFFKSFGLFSCAIVFLTTLQFFLPTTVEPSRAQLHSSDSAHAVLVSDAILEEAREGEFRLAPDTVISAGMPGILLLISSFLQSRQSAAVDRYVIAQHTSRAPPASSH
jgi:hypothetical protein